MTDEQRPWRAWDEYEACIESGGDMPDNRAALDALCARVWREALAYGTTLAEQQIVLTWKPQVDAAEAQRDRLAAALQKLHDAIDDFNAGSEKDDDERLHLCWLCGASTYGGDGVIHEPRCALLGARAALADVPEVVQNVLENPEAMAAIQRGWEDIQRGEPGVPVSELRRKDDRARRRDEAYRAMVEALERWQTISDRLGVPDAMWDSGEWAIVRQQGRDALALARQVEEA